MTLITGHRGARNLWAENSLTGFRNVLQLGVDAVEFDVHLTNAGELLVIHDAMLDRTAEGTGPVRLLTPEARAGMKLKGTDEGIPTLADVLDVIPPATGLALHVEIKLDETGTPYPGIAERIAQELARFGVEERTHLTSFDTSVLEDCRRYAPHIARLVSVNAAWAERQGGLAAFLDRVDDLVEIVAVHHELMEAQWDLIARTLPLERLCVWTLNDEETLRQWLERDIGHLTSDSPDIALALRAAQSSRSNLLQPTH
ncbi:glycerophosphodiester phosphodiesterase [Mesorhizobium sp. CGMCC 1.15528]|uniref:Glycerophosphodiester phosphodiesterase n=1 Tax=Mesorhizobium zhangyense TaxID=1776730 RepID=A0A7C9VFF3_9HYPH|nr:glycerophosphodiester phosphodiesterase family protein [Mesorhizobium zhangyense]NGN43652.1 glycerophosphodiester phosphodiesterase [Mesorhizobium zhangyense]